MNRPSKEDVLDVLARDGWLSLGVWYGDADSQDWLIKFDLLDRKGDPTQELKDMVPGLNSFTCIGPGVSYG